MTKIRLDQELVRRGLAPSRTEAQRMLKAGVFSVDGNSSPKQTRSATTATVIKVIGKRHPFVGRGGLKLEKALSAFGVDARDKRAIDIGSSTGGFTDCLLQRGAASVAAVDVGTDQLVDSLRNHPSVTVFEATNVRYVTPKDVGGPFDIVVCDVSFISLKLIAKTLTLLGRQSADWVLLVKPQFEVGKGRLGSGGVVRDHSLHVEALLGVVETFSSLGIGTIGLRTSPIEGAKGNREYLLHLRRGPATITHTHIQHIAEVS